MLDYAAGLGVNLADMKKLPEGLLYEDVGAGGAGDSAVAAPGDSVEIRFDGFLPSGTKVDSGAVAIRVGAGAVIRGLESAIPGMKTGGRRKLVLPPGLGYGADGTGTIPPNSVLVYDLELRRIIRGAG
jgi:FKBP-type peptidyl-prolyl cis-trans isomerase